MITDQQFIAFLEKLAADQRGKNSLNLNEWEDNFVRTYMSCNGGFFLTEGRRKAIDRMWRKYGHELNHPHPLDTVTERPKIAEADPDGCEYLIKGDAGQVRCNEPATHQEPGKLRYCQTHGETAVKAIARTGRTLRLIKFP